MFVHEIMTADPYVAKPNWSVKDVLRELHNGDFRHMPVVDKEGTLIGIVSERDLREYIMPILVADDFRETADEMLDQSVSQVMQSNVLTVGPETEVTDLIDIMLEQRVGAVPVVDVALGELLGIVSYIDILREAKNLF